MLRSWQRFGLVIEATGRMQDEVCAPCNQDALVQMHRSALDA